MSEMERLEKAAVPLRVELDRLRKEADLVRSELRRRERAERLRQRQEARAEMATGEVPSLEDAISGAAAGFDDAVLDDLRFLRESATEVRLGYASASHQSLSFTDGAATEEAFDVGTARELWKRGWEWGTPAAPGVRVYPVGSRAERVVPAAEVHVEPRPA
ncbi:MAG TPA: hypothetical protein VG329_02965 [Candidatus Dormibacteraeota bacterium]|jgi:hypothetical protein|nr:hypothetical protein [Candidatus Dormibacteraeota bacterium]